MNNNPEINEAGIDDTAEKERKNIERQNTDNKNDLIDDNEVEMHENKNKFPSEKESKQISEKPLEKMDVIIQSNLSKNTNFEYDENGNKIGRMKRIVHQKLKVPPRLFKTFIVTTILALLGVALIILGCIEEIVGQIPGRGIMFWILGAIVIIPGGFYSYQFYKAKKAKTEYQRDDIFEDIPEL